MQIKTSTLASRCTALLRPLPLSVAVALGLSLHFTGVAAQKVYKCEMGGQITYQSIPCPSAEPRKPPTPQERNARQRELDAKHAPAKPQPPQSTSSDTNQAPSSGRAPGFKCDGRTYCSQMTSCAEAKYFLANCPNVKMDGNNDGIPCEQQWCKY